NIDTVERAGVNRRDVPSNSTSFVLGLLDFTGSPNRHAQNRVEILDESLVIPSELHRAVETVFPHLRVLGEISGDEPHTPIGAILQLVLRGVVKENLAARRKCDRAGTLQALTRVIPRRALNVSREQPDLIPSRSTGSL